ncbi:signal peptidase [Bifidobacterium pseudolongum subsp. globosum]|uniref:Signal peptidase I n=2 Tax=Bifidobacterium pseudolongum TaxID=1694 RepID=A0A2N3QGD5_9BIFI|nr:signal peptidase [Bifidobacterium pseudolongum subsp. globosum]
MSNHHAGNPHRAPHAERGSAPRRVSSHSTNPHVPPAASAHFASARTAADRAVDAARTPANAAPTPSMPHRTGPRHGETRRATFHLPDARRANPRLIQLRIDARLNPYTPRHAAPPRAVPGAAPASSRRALNPHMPAAAAAPAPSPRSAPAAHPTPTAHFPRRAHIAHAAHARTSFTLRDILLWCVLPVLIVLGLRLFVFGMYAIPSGSMENTIMPGDRVITTRLSPRPIALRRGDIVVFKDPANWLANEGAAHNSDRLIKRLIGLPGDTVECAGGGAPIVINGVPIDESAYLKPGVEPSHSAFSVTVSAGRLFVLGDNRANSADSRAHTNDGAQGLVPVDDVEGVAFVRYWPFNRMGWLSAHHNVFRDVPTRAPTG